jgi:hypothetical protein
MSRNDFGTSVDPGFSEAPDAAASSEPDPIFEAIEKHRKANCAVYAAQAAVDDPAQIPAATVFAELDAMKELLDVVPTSRKERLAVLDYVSTYEAIRNGRSA